MQRFIVPVVAVFVVATAFAQRPVLVTEDAVTLGDGGQVVGLGVEYLRKSLSDAGVNLSHLWKGPIVHAEVGLGERVGLQLHWRGGLFAESPQGDIVSDYGDLFISTKVHIVREASARPAIGMKYSVKLPMTGDEDGLGSDNTDFFGSLLFSKKIGIVASRLNLGVGILGHPRARNAQDDIYTYGAAILLPVKQSAVLFAEATGFFGPFEDDDKLVGRFGFLVRKYELEWAAFGSTKISGTPRDFSTAFELSERWGIGVFVARKMQLW